MASDAGATGRLRVTAPSAFGRRTIIPILPALSAANPALKVDLQLGDEIVDLVGMGFDVGIRIASLRDSSLIARKLADNPRVLCASPAYLARHGRPRRMQDLGGHRCLRLANVPQWTFLSEDQPTAMSVDGPFTCSNVEGVRALSIAGQGIAQLCEWDVREEVAAGQLVRLDLEDAQPQQLSIWAVFPTSRHLPARVNVFLDALKVALQAPLG